MTLKQFKELIQVGQKITCIGREETRGESKELNVVPLNEKMAGQRVVTYKDTTGFYMSKDETRGSFLGWPKASELEVEGNNFNILFTDGSGNVWGKQYYSIA